MRWLEPGDVLFVYRVVAQPKLLLWETDAEIEAVVGEEWMDFDNREVAEAVCDAGYDGWTCPRNYPEGGADIMLCEPEEWLELVEQNPGEDIGLVEVEELGVRFATGEPVTFPYMHSTEPAPHFGAKFGQDIEPAGFYLLADTARAAEHPVPGWEYGEISFQSPLVLALTTTDDPMEPIYGPNGWKARLNRAYGGLTGADLSRALLADGYDAIVTVWVQGDAPSHTREIVDLRPVVLTSNPLDPYAFDTETRPFIIEGQPTSREQHLGVHTAVQPEVAVIYAVQRAMLDGSMAILLHLDVTGLEPLPDRDAILKASQEDPTWLFDEIDGLYDAVMAGDAELTAELFSDYEPDWIYSELGRPVAWTEAAIAWNAEAQDNAIWATLEALDPDELLEALQVLIERKTLPAPVWMEVVGQQRYMTPFGLDRVVQIDAVRPVREELWTWEEINESGSEYPPDDPDQPEIFCTELFGDEQWLPQLVTLWRNPDANPAAQVEYHGTDIARARSAFPELAAELVNPWPYTQPVVEDQASGMFMMPQSFIEAQAAGKLGVGLFPVARTTGRLLMGERSWAVDSPGEWSGFGGSVEGGESLAVAAVRELREETGYAGPIDLEEIAPRIFLGHVPDEYAPRLNWETEQARWLTLLQVAGLEPKHWGTDVLLAHLT